MKRMILGGGLLFSGFLSAHAGDGASPYSQEVNPAEERTEAPKPRKEKVFSLEPDQRAVWGSQKFFSSDSSLFIGLPMKFNLSFDYSFYRSATSSTTGTFYIGAGKDWTSGSLAVIYSWTPRASNYRAVSWSGSGSLHTDDPDLRTKLGLDFNVTKHTQMLLSPPQDFNFKQITPTASFSQRYYRFKGSVEFSKSYYDRDVQSLFSGLDLSTFRTGAFGGLLTGLPEMGVTAGLYEDVDALFVPLTFRFVFSHVKMLVTDTTQKTDSQSYTWGFDADVFRWLTWSGSYNLFNQSTQPAASYWGTELSLRF